MSVAFVERFEAKIMPRRARVKNLATKLTTDILDGTGDIGERLRLSTLPQQPGKEHPLSQELLDRVDNHPLVLATLRFTQRVLPVEHFLREDKKTPYIRHAERTALLLLDLLPKDMPLIEKMVQVAITLGHDSEEVPQEMLMKNLKEGLHPNARGGRTQEEVRAIFYEEMEAANLPKELKPYADEIYAGIHDFNCNNSDNTPKSDKQYLKGLKRKGHTAKKIVDRGMDSPQGDMSRIARMVEDALSGGTNMDSLQETLDERFGRLTRSTNKAQRLKPFARSLPKQQRDVNEFYEATIRAGRGFKHAVYERLANKRASEPATPVVIFDKAA